jgi:hypothetical protein
MSSINFLTRLDTSTAAPATVSSSLSVSASSLLVAAVSIVLVMDTSLLTGEWTHSIAGAATVAQRSRRHCEPAYVPKSRTITSTRTANTAGGKILDYDVLAEQQDDRAHPRRGLTLRTTGAAVGMGDHRDRAGIACDGRDRRNVGRGEGQVPRQLDEGQSRRLSAHAKLWSRARCMLADRFRESAVMNDQCRALGADCGVPISASVAQPQAIPPFPQATY